MAKGGYTIIDLKNYIISVDSENPTIVNEFKKENLEKIVKSKKQIILNNYEDAYGYEYKSVTISISASNFTNITIYLSNSLVLSIDTRTGETYSFEE